MGRAKSTANLVGSLTLVIALAGCAARDAEDVALEDMDAEQIYKLGEASLANSKRPDNAIGYFSEVERLYPYSEWAKRALIMEAYGYHKARKYEDSRATAQRYLDTYPGSEDAAYASYLLALSYYDQIDEVGRDQGLTFQALQALREVIEKYPDTEYARSAILKFDLAFNHLAGKEMEIGRFLQRRGQWLAATLRFRNVIDDYQTTTHTPEALERLVESYLALGIPEEAKKAAAVLGANYPGSKWYEHAYKLIREHGTGA